MFIPSYDRRSERSGRTMKCTARYIVTLLNVTTTIRVTIPNRISETLPVESFRGLLGPYDGKALFLVFIRIVKDFLKNSSEAFYSRNSR